MNALKYLDAGGSSAAFDLGNKNGFSVQDVIFWSRQVTQRAMRADEDNWF